MNFAKSLILMAFNVLITQLINRITIDPLRDFLKAQILPAKQVTEILFDSNPNNSEQLKEFWDKYQKDLKHHSIEGIIDIIQNSKLDPFVKETVINILSSLDENGRLLMTKVNTIEPSSFM